MRILGNTGMELHDAEEAMRMRRILAGDIRKESTNQGAQLLDFTDIQRVMQVQSPTYTPTQEFHQWRR